MIKVKFKNSFENEFTGNEYTYKDFENITIGDIVCVNTAKGYAIAQVTQTDIIDTKFNLEELKEVKCVIESKAEKDKQEKLEWEKRQKYNELYKKIKKTQLLAGARQLIQDKEDLELLESMDYEDLKKLCSKI